MPGREQVGQVRAGILLYVTARSIAFANGVLLEKLSPKTSTPAVWALIPHEDHVLLAA